MAQAGLVFGRYILQVGFESTILLHQPSLCSLFYDSEREQSQGIPQGCCCPALLALSGREGSGRKGAGSRWGAWRAKSLEDRICQGIGQRELGVHTCESSSLRSAVALRSGQKRANSKRASRRNSSIFRLQRNKKKFWLLLFVCLFFCDRASL